MDVLEAQRRKEEHASLLKQIAGLQEKVDKVTKPKKPRSRAKSVPISPVVKKEEPSDVETPRVKRQRTDSEYETSDDEIKSLRDKMTALQKNLDESEKKATNMEMKWRESAVSEARAQGELVGLRAELNTVKSMYEIEKTRVEKMLNK